MDSDEDTPISQSLSPQPMEPQGNMEDLPVSQPTSPQPSTSTSGRKETAEQKQRTLELRRQRRADRTPEQRDHDNASRRKRHQSSMSTTPEAKSLRIESARQRRARATSEEREKKNEYQRNRRALLRRLPADTQNVARVFSAQVEENYLGIMNASCDKCEALHFDSEKVRRGHFSSCCENGKVVLPQLQPYPQPLLSWLTTNNEDGRHFKENIRSYNSAFAFASFGFKAPELPTLRKGLPVVVIHGQTYHQTSETLKIAGKEPSYAQLYTVDPDYANSVRESNAHNKSCKSQVFACIHSLLQELNPFAQAFQMMREVMQKSGTETINMWLIKDRTQDPRRYNLPITNEVAAIFTSQDGEPPSLYQRDICIHPRNPSHSSGLQFVSTISPNCNPMTYPILFPFGEPGWQTGKTEEQKLKKTNGSNLTQQDFYAYRLQVRSQFSPLLHAGKLTQQFIIDAFLKVEGGRLFFMCQDKHQQQLRVDKYMGWTLLTHKRNSDI